MSAPVMLESSLSSLPLIGTGKVRDIYAIDDERLLLVQTDRISAFDYVLADGIPGKGAALTAMSIAWFSMLDDQCRNHLLAANPADVVAPEDRDKIAGRSMVVRKCKPLPAEAIARGYLAGSGWQSYQKSGQICSIDIASGLELASKLPEPIFTPSTKAEAGMHDENITYQQLTDLIGEHAAERMRDLTLKLYGIAHDKSLERGMIMADTKFEFAADDDGELILIDEVLTPDSSRYWDASTWQPGQNPQSFDKQFVRDWLINSGWDRNSEPPALPAEIIEQTAERYAHIASVFAS